MAESLSTKEPLVFTSKGVLIASTHLHDARHGHGDGLVPCAAESEYEACRAEVYLADRNGDVKSRIRVCGVMRMSEKGGAIMGYNKNTCQKELPFSGSYRLCSLVGGCQGSDDLLRRLPAAALDILRLREL